MRNISQIKELSENELTPNCPKQHQQKKKEKKENGHKNSKDISLTFSGVVGSVGSLPRRFPLFSFFCLLVSSVSAFHPDTRGAVVDTFFLGSLVQSCCGKGRMLQTNNTGVCSQCLSHAGHAPAHGALCSGSMLLLQEPSEASPRLHALPWSKQLRLGSQVALRGAGLVGPVFCALPRTE